MRVHLEMECKSTAKMQSDFIKKYAKCLIIFAII